MHTKMKKITLSVLSFISISVAAFSQNIGIGTSTPAHTLDVVSAVSASNNAAIYATNTGTSGNAVLGVANSIGTYGVRGLSNTGTGVQGYTSGGYALAGSAITGTAVFAQSNTGYGLIAAGKLKLSGGNTNPSDGALLTSDATGNATWKRSNLAFYANSAINTAIPAGNTWTKVEFNNEEYDTQNNFVDYAGAVTSGSSVFTAPLTGVYHFSSSVLLEKLNIGQSQDISDASIKLVQGGNLITTSKSPGIWRPNTSYCYLYIDVDIHLTANEKIWVEVVYNHGGGALATCNQASYNGRFNGELISAD
jgi:hypothetical protein